ncbi:MAG: DUF4399 domain-containing protein [Actinomycetota bacterium]|nr:DUF4399 domain-containing protein [Actinomycetota bacterium]
MSAADRFAWRWRAAAVAVALLLIPVARSTFQAGTPKATPAAHTAALSIASPAEGSVLGGNVVQLFVEAAAATAFFAFADRNPPAPGTTMREGRGAVRSTEPLVAIGGLARGRHRITVVIADEAGVRANELTDSVTVTTTGPATLIATAAARSVEGDPWPISVEVSGIEIVPANGDTSGVTGHLHFLIDAPLPAPGAPIPLDADNVVHTTETTVPLAGLEAGEHHVWIVVGDGSHRPLSPYVADEVFVTVTP